MLNELKNTEIKQRIEFALKLLKFDKVANAESILMQIIHLSDDELAKIIALNILLDREMQLKHKNWVLIDDYIKIANSINGFDQEKINHILNLKNNTKKKQYSTCENNLSDFILKIEQNFLIETSKCNQFVDLNDFILVNVNDIIKNKEQFDDDWCDRQNSETKLLHDFIFENEIDIKFCDDLWKQISPIIDKRVQENHSIMYFLDSIDYDINSIMRNIYLGNINKFYNTLEKVYLNNYIPYGFAHNRIVIFSAN